MARPETEVALLKDVLKVLINDKNAIGNQTLTVTNTAQSLTPTANASRALIQVQSSVATTAIRYWEDGSVPAVGIGMSQGNAALIELLGSENIRNFKVIQDTGGVTQLNITYYA